MLTTFMLALDREGKDGRATGLCATGCGDLVVTEEAAAAAAFVCVVALVVDKG